MNGAVSFQKLAATARKMLSFTLPWSLQTGGGFAWSQHSTNNMGDFWDPVTIT